MADEARQRNEAHQQEVLHAVEVLLSDGSGYAGYRRRQREAGRRGATDARGARPREFDESGFPLPQGRNGFARRVARLLNV
jgi:hypothetical protein